MNRASDRGTIKAISGWMADYRAIIWPIAIALMAFGFKINWPSQRIDALEATQKVDHANVQVLVKLQCFNPAFTDEQRAMAGLESCNSIRQGLPDPSVTRK